MFHTRACNLRFKCLKENCTPDPKYLGVNCFLHKTVFYRMLSELARCHKILLYLHIFQLIVIKVIVR